MKKWKVLESKELIKTPFFKLRTDKCELSNGKIMPGYYTFDFHHWVNVVPITKDKKIVLVSQYRHSGDYISLEIPGGAVHKGEDIQVSALRELEEETGYSSKRVELLGNHFPNPALQSNQLFTYLALDCELTSNQNLDPYEEIEVKLFEIDQIDELIYSGQINHSLIIASLFFLKKKLGKM